jgi:hypothetical protein
MKRDKSFDMYVKDSENKGLISNLVMKVSKSIGRLKKAPEIDSPENIKDFREFLEKEIFPLQREYLKNTSPTEYQQVIQEFLYPQEKQFDLELNQDLRERLAWIEYIKKSPALEISQTELDEDEQAKKKGALDNFLCTVQDPPQKKTKSSKSNVNQSGTNGNKEETELINAFTVVHQDTREKRIIKQKMLELENLNKIYEEEIQEELTEIEEAREYLGKLKFNMEKEFEIRGKIMMDIEHVDLLLDAVENDDTGNVELTVNDEEELLLYRWATLVMKQLY